MGFLLSAALEIPAKLTTEIIRADNNDIIFFIFFPSIININDKVCSDLKV
jgi:hypothetical protein